MPLQTRGNHKNVFTFSTYTFSITSFILLIDGVINCWKTSESEVPSLARENHRGRTVTSFCFWYAIITHEYIMIVNINSFM